MGEARVIPSFVKIIEIATFFGACACLGLGHPDYATALLLFHIVARMDQKP